MVFTRTGVVVVALRVKELAEARGLSLATLQRTTNIPLMAIRRYWYNSTSGLERDAGTLREVNLTTLSAIATRLDVHPGDLLGEHDEGALHG